MLSVKPHLCSRMQQIALTELPPEATGTGSMLSQFEEQIGVYYQPHYRLAQLLGKALIKLLVTLLSRTVSNNVRPLSFNTLRAHADINSQDHSEYHAKAPKPVSRTLTSS